MNNSDKTTGFGNAEMIANIVSAYASRPDVTVDEIVSLVARLTKEMGGSINAARIDQAAPPPADAPVRPAIALDKAVTEDKVYCLCCGKGFKMLKRHLGAEHELTEDQYRAMFNLSADVPLVAPSYSERKASYARRVGFGKYSRAATEPADQRITGQSGRESSRQEKLGQEKLG
ncbi:MucR family transcriptional regulator [Tabrizicola sp. WMC-M-20]|nr:MucR family transcriptional regulator [Tabrizicola sp. WMC-M-20]